jgi:hypothetical protein
LVTTKTYVRGMHLTIIFFLETLVLLKGIGTSLPPILCYELIIKFILSKHQEIAHEKLSKWF